MLESNVSAVPSPAYTRVFFHQVRKPGVSQTVRRFSQCQLSGQRFRVSACWSLINAVSATNTNGSTKNKAAAIASACTATQFKSFVRRATRPAAVIPTAGAAMDVVKVIGGPLVVRGQEATAPAHQQCGECHRQDEQHECDHGGATGVEPLEAQVINELWQGQCRLVGIPRLELLP